MNSSINTWTARGIDAEVIIRQPDALPEEWEAIGLSLRCGRAHGRIMAFIGGWVDFEFSEPTENEGESLLEIHPITDAGVGAVVESLIDRLLSLCDELATAKAAT